MTTDDLLRAGQHGHFRLASGFHTDLWLDLDLLLLRPRALRPLVSALAGRLARYEVDAVCGPVVGGALLAYAVAADLGREFYRGPRLPRGSWARVRGKRVAVVDDAVSAGSAVLATADHLTACGAEPVVVGALLVLGEAGAGRLAARGLPLESLARRSCGLWRPEECPLCRAGVPLGEPG